MTLHFDGGAEPLSLGCEDEFCEDCMDDPSTPTTTIMAPAPPGSFLAGISSQSELYSVGSEDSPDEAVTIPVLTQLTFHWGKWV
eukprot:CAMPEP_0202917990 /NCGR_PEP_ID=MMETSP1392-20130828/72354_1 /ASSEMBLY_ACC=CAM_ASM_000868 /TAXON_ID=225041 /ORGANISM="Chlamydomonas chlamydogama, Strain SAG 11-48b" /LENGTH=83 /DNA_ID=CAMNT_0049610905 /DNA_START=62 /DNA_END=313 /DNA_ORIENTATION=-